MGGRVLECMGRTALALLLAAASLGAPAAPAEGDLAVQAREAWAKRDRKRLAALVDTARAQ